MPEHLAVDANEHTMIETPLPTPLHIRLARYISNILAPASVSLPFVLLVAFYHAQSLGSALYYACITLFFLSFGPMVYIIIGVRMGKFSDVDVSRRSERVGPFLFGITSGSLGYILLYFSHGPKNLQTSLMITGVSALILMIITRWGKISIITRN